MLVKTDWVGEEEVDDDDDDDDVPQEGLGFSGGSVSKKKVTVSNPPLFLPSLCVFPFH